MGANGCTFVFYKNGAKYIVGQEKKQGVDKVFKIFFFFDQVEVVKWRQ